MEMKEGRLYFIDDSFFKKINDPYLKLNYENTKRPHFLALQDTQTSLYWMIPCSSKIEKFEAIIAKKQQQGKKTNAIKIVKIQDRKAALLFQDMFPLSNKYITQQYIRGGEPVYIGNSKEVENLKNNGKKIISLLRKGIRFTPTQPDITRIEKIMLDEIKDKKLEKVTDKKMTLDDKIASAMKKSEQHNQTPKINPIHTKKKNLDR